MRIDLPFNPRQSFFTSPPPSGLRTFTAAEFLSLDLPEPKFLLKPWLPEAGLVMIHAPTGIGKTLFSTAAAVAIASGTSFLRFEAPSAKPVLYIDGEMPATLMQKRFAEAVGLTGSFDQNLFRIYCAALTDDEAPDLSTIEGQQRIDAEVKDAAVIFIDNISALCRTGKDNEAESWRPVNSWLMAHRRAGRAVVIIHHDNKSGDQRGTSKKLDALDAVIHLRKPANYDKSQGARFEVHFTKTRHFWGLDAQPLEASLTTTGWVMSDIIPPDPEAEVRDMHDAGMSYRQIAGQMGMNKNKIASILKGHGQNYE